MEKCLILIPGQEQEMSFLNNNHHHPNSMFHLIKYICPQKAKTNNDQSSAPVFGGTSCSQIIILKYYFPRNNDSRTGIKKCLNQANYQLLTKIRQSDSRVSFHVDNKEGVFVSQGCCNKVPQTR